MRATAWLTFVVMALLLLATGAGCGGPGAGTGGDGGAPADAAAGEGGDASSDAAQMDGGAPSITVVTYNILHGLNAEDPAAGEYDAFAERLPLITAALRELRPDVVMLQETFQGAENGYPDVIGTLRDAMNLDSEDHYTVIFGPITGQPATKGRGALYGQITMTRLPVVSYANHPVVAVAALSPRSVLHVRVEGAGATADFYNAHLQGPDEAGPAAVELNDVLAFVDATAAPGGLTVLGGDLNSPEDAPVYDIVRAAGYLEAGAACGLVCSATDNSGCTNSAMPLRQPGNRTTKRLDYIFVRGATPDPRGCGLVGGQPVPLDGGVLWPSDHIGLSARLTPC